ncbi:MAG: glycosyltransferase family 2 protein [Flavobacteriaceae bacterium]|nr:glycosyltransferase family 2 protein [Flavobacteriaceae bacterium]
MTGKNKGKIAKPFFSVIIPLYNKENFIQACLKSVIQQEFEDFELIIIDDGSTDHSLVKANEIKDHRIQIFQQKNQGASHARNSGAIKARADYIAFLDADDEWYPNYLACIYKMIQKHPQHAVFATNYEVEIAPQEFRKTRFSVPLKNSVEVVNDFFEASLKDALFLTISVVLKKSTFIELGGFNPLIASGQDTDLFIRLGVKHPIVFSKEIGAKYNLQSENNLSKSPNFESRLNYLKAYDHIANKSLKKYLNLNRFSIGMRAKMAKHSAYYKAKKQIDFTYLNTKQKILLALPSLLLHAVKKTQVLLAKKGIYISSV